MKYLRLLRIHNGLLASFAIFICPFIDSYRINERWFLAIISCFLLTSYANVLNDFFDYELDKLAKPYRPLPSGQISLRKALVISILLLISGLFFSAKGGWDMFSFALFNSFLIFLYNYKLKKNLFDGNICVGFLGASPFLYGGLALHSTDVLIPFSVALLFHISREIIKDIEDTQFDLQFGYKTLPIIWGRYYALLFSNFVFSASFIFLLMPLWFKIYSKLYAVIAIPPAFLCSFYFPKVVLDISKVKKLNKMMKISSVIVMIAFLFAK